MSPASAGALQIEQYIGACLISQNRPKNLKNYGNNNVYHQNHPVAYGNYHQDGWAGGVPLISFANHQRRHTNNRNFNEYEEPNSNLSRLAVHTQGAPLIVTKSYQHRKNKPQRTDGVQQTKIFENSNHKKHLQNLQEVMESHKNVDTISVTSDESSGSQNSVEMCLPRIIKPRKRRKKDRKPPHLRIQSQSNDFEYNTPLSTTPPNNFSSPFQPNNLNTFEYNNRKVPEVLNPMFELFNEISETPKLHHNFEDVKEDLNGNQPSINCQCRYCNPSGHNIWDVDRDCYSPFLTPPKVFDFGTLENVLSSILNEDHSFSSNSDDSKRRSSFSRSWSSSSGSSFGSSDLEVSTEIVTSLNGHRDLEIRFFNPSLVENKNVDSKKDASNSFTVAKETKDNGNFFSFSVNNVKDTNVNSARCDQDGLCEQNTSFFSNGTIAF